MLSGPSLLRQHPPFSTHTFSHIPDRSRYRSLNQTDAQLDSTAHSTVGQRTAQQPPPWCVNGRIGFYELFYQRRRSPRPCNTPNTAPTNNIFFFVSSSFGAYIQGCQMTRVSLSRNTHLNNTRSKKNKKQKQKQKQKNKEIKINSNRKYY